MLKLGTGTGSLINHVYSRMGNPTPEVGMGATECLWSDRHAVTVVEVTAKYIVTQRDNVKRSDTNGMSESQSYEYTPNPEAFKQYWKKDKKGQYRQAWLNDKGNLVFNGSSTHLGLGYRDEYYDFSF